MDQKTIIAVIAFFAVLVAGMFGYTYLKKSELAEQAPAANTATTTESAADVPHASVTRIEGTHYFSDGTHTVVGEILMPTPCDLLEADATVEESDPPEITLTFSVINNAEFCAQQVTPQRYQVTADAPEDATFRAVFMGREIELNLVPAAPGETPEDFERFIKG